MQSAVAFGVCLYFLTIQSIWADKAVQTKSAIKPSAAGGLVELGKSLPSRLADRTSLKWSFDAKESFYLPETLDLNVKDTIMNGNVPVSAKVTFKKLDKFKYDNKLQLSLGKISTGRIVLDGTRLSFVDCRLPVDFATIEPRLNFPEVEPEILVGKDLSDRAKVRAILVPLAPKKIAKLLFNFDVDSKTSLGIQPLLGDGKQTKLTLDRKFKHAMLSATLFQKTATLTASIHGLKPSISVDIKEPLKSKPKIKLSYSVST